MSGSHITKCRRCYGAMTYDGYSGAQGQFGGWKCLICGEFVDPVILKNRELMRESQGITLAKAH